MIKYKVVERENPVTRVKTYFAQVAPVEPVTLEQVVKRIEKSSTVSSADIKAVLDALQFEVIQCLQDGKSVRLGDLGSFRPTISSRSAESAETFLPSNIKRVRVQFSPSGTMLEEMSLDRLSIHRMGEEADPGADQEGGL